MALIDDHKKHADMLGLDEVEAEANLTFVVNQMLRVARANIPEQEILASAAMSLQTKS